MICKVKIIKELGGVFPEYQPKVGETYLAEYIAPCKSYQKCPPICIIEILGKRIIVKKDEFELVG